MMKVRLQANSIVNLVWKKVVYRQPGINKCRMHIGLRIIVHNIGTCFYIPNDLSNLWYISIYGESFTSCRILPVEALISVLFYDITHTALIWRKQSECFPLAMAFSAISPIQAYDDWCTAYVIIYTSISLLIFTELTYIVLFIVLEKRITLSLRYETVLRRNWEH